MRKKAQVKIVCLVDMPIFLNIKFYENGTLIYLLYWTCRVIPVSKIYRWNMVQWRFYYLLLFPLLLYLFLVLSSYISLVLQFCSILNFSPFRKQVWQNNKKSLIRGETLLISDSYRKYRILLAERNEWIIDWSSWSVVYYSKYIGLK